MCAFIFSTIFVQNISHSTKNSAKHFHKRTQVPIHANINNIYYLQIRSDPFRSPTSSNTRLNETKWRHKKWQYGREWQELLELPYFSLSGNINFLGSTPWIKDGSNFYNVLSFPPCWISFPPDQRIQNEGEKKSDSHVSDPLSPPPSTLFNRPQPVDKANCSLRTFSKQIWRW